MEAVGFPVPAALALLIAGGASGSGSLSFPLVLAGSALAMIVGDVLMFLLGRHTGWWMLGFLCRLSLNPESCILSSADSFFRRGRTVLVFAKFVPGINTMAPPLAGSMNMRFGQFLWLDSLGTVLYVGTYLGVGFLFSGALESVTRNYETASGVLGWVLSAAFAVYILYQFWSWMRARKMRAVVITEPVELAKLLHDPRTRIYDVRSHGYYDRRAERIHGSQRLDPNSLHQVNPPVPPGYRIFLYCTCVREATSARVAHELRKMGIETTVIRGGFRAWKKAGLPVETVPASEVSLLPVFEP